MTREEAIKKVRQMSLPKETMEILEALAPELAESEDERIRKKMIEHFKSKTKDTWCNMPVKSILAWLEKQKELPFIKDVILGYPGIYFYDGERMHFRGSPAMEEKKKEPNYTKRNELFDKCVENCDPKVMKEVIIPAENIGVRW